MVLSEKIEINVVFPEQFGGIYAVTGYIILYINCGPLFMHFSKCKALDWWYD